MDRKINTAAEVAAQRIARAEIAKQDVNLLYRQYLFGAYNMTTNAWTLGTRISFEGISTPLSAIQKIDAVSSVKILPAANANQTPATWINPGTNVVAMVNPMDGFRQANEIKVHGVTFGVRAWLPQLTAIQDPVFEHSVLHWRVSSANYHDMELVASLPSPEQLMPMKRFGYTAKLDAAELSESQNFKSKILGQGTIRLRHSTLAADVKLRQYYLNLRDSPVRVRYDPLDQNGQEVTSNKLFLTLRSSVSTGAGFVYQQPIVNCFAKVHYVDT